MSSALLSLITTRVREAGRITVAEFIERALYEPALGYYTGTEQRSGSQGDFFTSVDLGPLFGGLLAGAMADVWRRLGEPASFDLVEAAAGNGRLTAGILDGLARRHPACYTSTHVSLVERSDAARAAQPATLARHTARLVSSSTSLPAHISGVLYANELLDAMPSHLVVMRRDGLREVYVTLRGHRLVTCEGPPSTPAIGEYLQRAEASLPLDCFGEVNLAAADWTRRAARALERGLLLLVDYGHEARDLYSTVRPQGTLATFKRHAVEARDEGPGWLLEPGERDITAHVDLTSICLAATSEGLEHLGTMDQSSFLLSQDVETLLGESGLAPDEQLRRRLAMKTLLMPNGLGSTLKVMLFGRGIGHEVPAARPLRPRLT